jgi:quinol monooxygenase YgiN
MTEPFALVVRFTLAPGAARAFDELVARTVESIRSHEPGTLIYAVHHVDGKPEQRIFYELYRDRAAFDAHEEQPHTRHFLSERDRYLVSTEVDFLSVRTGKGVPVAPPA